MSALYKVSYVNPLSRLIPIEVIFNAKGKKEFVFCLPAWRPGRYELGNFSKNIISLKVVNQKGEPRSFKKLCKDKWQVELQNDETITVNYTYFTPELTAGSCWMDDRQLYVNGTNCFMYEEGILNEECLLELNVPGDFKIACSLKKKDAYYVADTFHTLVDSPFIASKYLERNFFILDGVEVNLWFMGFVKPVWSKLVNDFFIFINEHFVLFKEYTGTEYHFLFQDVPYSYRHGVEHLHSTVIAMGPAAGLMEGDAYHDLLAISCHEFFHVYNIKMIRPTEMHPYNYSSENYSKLGYVYEGVTTYYGDYLLFRSGIFSEEEYIKCIEEQIDLHFYNDGRLNMSVADSSYDTWLDGYVIGAPGRKVSIYNEGALCAFMCDILIRKHSKNTKSLDDVMFELYHEFAKKGKSYSAQDYRSLCEKHASKNLSELFDDLINGTYDYRPLLDFCLNEIGLKISESPADFKLESLLGIRLIEDGSMKIHSVHKDSEAARLLSVGYKLISINGKELNGKSKKEISEFIEQGVNTLIIGDLMQQRKEIELQSSKCSYFLRHKLLKVENSHETQIQLFYSWSKRKF